MENEEIFPEPKRKKREPSPVYLLAVYFVTEILGREWTATDIKGIHLIHAKSVYDQYGTTDVMGCLEAWRDGLLGGMNYWPPKTLAGVRYGEPPMIELWLAWKASPPPIYLQEENREWRKRTNQVGPCDISPAGEPSDDVQLHEVVVRPPQKPPED